MGVRWRLIAVAAVSLALAGGCSQGPAGNNQVASLSDAAQPSDGQAADGKTDEDQMREFAACMREHGIEMDDPTSGPGGGGISISVQGDDESKMKAADEACKPLLPNGGRPPKLDAADLDRMRETAKCLREHGLDVPDPDPNDPGFSFNGVDQDKVKAAMEACGETGGPGKGKVEINNGEGGGK